MTPKNPKVKSFLGGFAGPGKHPHSGLIGYFRKRSGSKKGLNTEFTRYIGYKGKKGSKISGFPIKIQKKDPQKSGLRKALK